MLTQMSDHMVIENLGDRPDLIEPLADLRWHEWGPEPGRERREDWVALTARESGRRLPVTFAAVTAAGDVVGGVGLAEHDLVEYLPQATPWIVGMVVQPRSRRCQVGTALLARLERWAVDLGSERVWVATGGEPAVRFYQSCGWDIDEDAEAACTHRASVLVKAVAT